MAPQASQGSYGKSQRPLVLGIDPHGMGHRIHPTLRAGGRPHAAIFTLFPRTVPIVVAGSARRAFALALAS